MDTPTENIPAGTEGQATPTPTAQTDNSTLFGILSYIGPLVIVSFLVAKEHPFVKFHIKQGLILLAIEVAVWFVGMIFWQLWTILNVLDLGALVLSIIGIVNVVQHKEKELPLVGQFSQYLKF